MASEFVNPNLDPNVNNRFEHRIGAELHDWEYNDTIDQEDIALNVRKCINSLYTTSIANQIADCNIKRVGGKMSDFKKDLNAIIHYQTKNPRAPGDTSYEMSANSYILKYPLKNVFFFNNLFLHRINRRSTNKRKFFSNDNIHTPLTILNKFDLTEIPNRPDVFTHRLLMFIDGYLFTDLMLYVTPEYVLMVLDANRDGITLDQLNEYCDPKKDYRWTLIGLPFSATMKYDDKNKKWGPERRLVLHKQAIDTSGIPRYVMELSPFKSVCNYKAEKNMWLLGLAPKIVEMDYTPPVFDEGETPETVHIVDNKSLMAMKFDRIGTISSGPYMTLDEISNLISMSRLNDENALLTAQVINIPNYDNFLKLGTHRIFTYGCTDDKTSPIPPENMIPFIYTEGYGYRLVHMYNDDETDSEGNKLVGPRIRHYFPNVYKLEGFSPSAYVCILIFYGNHDKTTFKNPIKSYMDYNKNYANDIITGELPEVIMSYIPAVNTYFEHNYLKYHATATRHIEHEYKLETLKELVYDDYSRLTNIYLDHSHKHNLRLHANPKYRFDLSERTDIRAVPIDVEITTTSIDPDGNPIVVVETVAIDYYKFVINHSDGRNYPVTVWADGERLNNMQAKYEFDAFKTIIFIRADTIRSNAVITIEMYKILDNTPKQYAFQMPNKDNSMQIPRDIWDDISPQNMMIGVRKELPGENNTVEYKYEMASNYEMYWLIMGHTAYKNGVPMNYTRRPYTIVSGFDVITNNNNDVLLQDDTTAIVGDYDSRLVNNRNDDTIKVLKSLGDETYYKVHDDEYAEDFVVHPNLGYYGKDRKRFYAYMPYGNDDPSIWITPITDYFANEHVIMKNTDVYFSKQFMINVDDDPLITIEDFQLDPNPSKFRIFVDGQLIDYGHDYSIDVQLDRGWYIGSDVRIKLHPKNWNPGVIHVVVFEYLPYKYELLYRNDEYDGNIILRDDFKRPFNLEFYDVYIDGKILSDKDITVVTDRCFTINSISTNILNKLEPIRHTISIYQRAHDRDVIDYVWRDSKAEIRYTGDLENDDGDIKYANDNIRVADVRKAVPIQRTIIDEIMRTDLSFRRTMLPSWDPAIEERENRVNLGLATDDK